MIRILGTAFVLAGLALGLARPAAALTDQQELIDRSKVALEAMIAKPENETLRALLDRARAVLIAPELIKGGFFIGGEGGRAVLLMRGNDGQWSAPAFYTVGGISFGLQFGGQTSELVLAIMSEKGLAAIMEKKLKLGGEAGIAVGNIGKGVEAGTGLDLDADMYAFSNAKGLFGGAALEGTVIEPNAEWNAAYYGAGATVNGILVTGEYSRAGATGLRTVLPQGNN